MCYVRITNEECAELHCISASITHDYGDRNCSHSLWMDEDTGEELMLPNLPPMGDRIYGPYEDVM